MSSVSHDADLTSEDVDEPGEDEDVRYQSSRAQLRQVAHQRKRQEYEELNEYEPFDTKHGDAVRDSFDKRGEVLRYEDDVCAHETQLGDRDGGEDGKTHPGAVQSTTDVSKTAGNNEFGLH